MAGITLTVNGSRREVQAPADTPLLYVLRNELELSGPQFGCGLSQCGACSVLVDGKEVALLRAAGAQRRRQGSHHARRAARAVGQTARAVGREAARTCTRCSRRGSTNRCRSAASARAA